MPHVIIKLAAGRTLGQKASMAADVTKAVMGTAKCEAKAVSVAVEDIDPQDWLEKVYKPDIIGAWERLFKKPGYDPL